MFNIQPAAGSDGQVQLQSISILTFVCFLRRGLRRTELEVDLKAERGILSHEVI